MTNLIERFVDFATGEVTANVDNSATDTDALTIGGAGLVSTGNFVAVGGVQTLLTSASTTSTTYIQVSEADVQFTWDKIIPPNAQGAVYASVEFGTGDSQGDFRIFQFVDSETIVEFSDFVGSKDQIVNYTPTTTNSVMTSRWQIRTNDGGTQTTILPRSTTYYGVQL